MAEGSLRTTPGSLEEIARDAWLRPVGGRPGQLLGVISTGLLMTFAFPLRVGTLELPAELRALLAWIGFAPLILVAAGRTPRRVAALFFASAWIYFTLSLTWLVVTMHDFGGVPVPFALLGLMMLSGVLALFHAGAGYLAGRIAARWQLALVAPAALAMTAIEYVRNYLFTGFPWSNPAYSQTAFLHMIQSADVVGIYGLTFLIVFVGGALGFVGRWLFRGDRRVWRHLAIAAGLLALTWGYGIVRLPAVRAASQNGKPLRIGLLQGNIPMDMEWLTSRGAEITRIYAEQVRLAQAKGAELVVWPEGALSFPVPADATVMRADAFPPSGPGVPQIIGALSYLEPTTPEARPVMYNSAFLVDGSRKVLARYDKSHLVPFGEYLPFRSVLSVLGSLVAQVGTFEQGAHVGPISDGRHKYGVLICYENLFPEIGRAMGRQGMELIATITNDTWYGWSMPHQHLDMAIFRAVESRVPAVQAANSGISAFIDATGDVIEQSNLYQREVRVRELRLAPASSVYLVVGDAFALACLVVSIVGAFVRRPARSHIG